MSHELAVTIPRLPAMDFAAVTKVRDFEDFALGLPQVDIATSHTIHGGMYARTIKIPAGVIITGALIKIATIIVVQGDVTVYIGTDIIKLQGYNVLPASANRKQAFMAETDVFLTMLFPSEAKSVEEAEEEFTDEAYRLISRKVGMDNQIIITGE